MDADYKSAHLAWLKTTKNFSPKYAHDYREASYLEVMTTLYADVRIPQTMAKAMFVGDKCWYLESRKIAKQIDKDIEKATPTPNGYWFVTLGFNHDTWTISDCKKCIEKILGMDWIIQGKANFELFRQNGEHPHAHFLIETKEPKSRILEKLFRPLYTKKVVFKKNFIDVKTATPVHHDYINLIKQESKMPFVARDIGWRNENNIPDYEKNWTLTKENIM
jgi:hypothetical protein